MKIPADVEAELEPFIEATDSQNFMLYRSYSLSCFTLVRLS